MLEEKKRKKKNPTFSPIKDLLCLFFIFHFLKVGHRYESVRFPFFRRQVKAASWVLIVFKAKWLFCVVVKLVRSLKMKDYLSLKTGKWPDGGVWHWCEVPISLSAPIMGL